MTRHILAALFATVLALASAVVALAQDGDQPPAMGNATPPSASDSMPAASPAIAISGLTVTGHDVRFHVDVQGATLATAPASMDMSSMNMDPSMAGMSMPMTPDNGSHLHVYVDNTMLQMVTQPEIDLADVPSGSHDVRVELATNLHQPYNPPVQATMTVQVP